MVSLGNGLPVLELRDQVGYRLVNSKFPPIALFDDVADEKEFEDLYYLQSLVNPRVQTEVGNLNLIPREEIPFGIPGCSYAMAPFTHVNPEGSRFSNGQFGVLYLAENYATALAEIQYHQSCYWQKVDGLKYDRMTFRGLVGRFNAGPVQDLTQLEASHPVYDPQSYVASSALGVALKKRGSAGVQYCSVRSQGHRCWGLFTPRGVKSLKQGTHFEMIWDGARISAVNKITRV